MAHTSAGTLVGTLASRTDLSPALEAVAVLFVAVLTAVAAQVTVQLPFTPVPLTLQPMIVLLGGAALGARLGMASQILYLCAGAAGLPVFAASTVLLPGVLRLLGPTGGYLFSYPFAAYLTGLLAERGFDRRYLTSVLAMAAGLAVIFTGGVTWLALFARPGAVGFEVALATGFYAFLPVDIYKILVAATILPAVWKFIGVRSS
jgi:biotin transport system substrate-specific component